MTVGLLKKLLNEYSDEQEIHLVNWENGIVQDFYGFEQDDDAPDDTSIYISYQ